MGDITKQQIDKIIRQLESVNLRPHMYMAEHYPAVFNFLYGVICACNALGIELYRYEDIWRKVEEERGWQPGSSMRDQLIKAGLNNDETTQEMLELYIEVCNRISDTLSRENDQNGMGDSPIVFLHVWKTGNPMSKPVKHQIDQIIWRLELVKKRPLMYMADHFPPVSNFLYGFVTACQAFGIEVHQEYRDTFYKVSEERGWKFGSSHTLWDQMSEAGLIGDEITQEMLTVYIEVWRRVENTLT